jgi:hypothetical protein
MDGPDSLRDFEEFMNVVLGNISKSGTSLNLTLMHGSLLQDFGSSELRGFANLLGVVKSLDGLSSGDSFGSSGLRVFVYFMGPLLMLNPTRFRHAECTKTVDLIGLMDLHHRKSTCLFPQSEPEIDRSGLLFVHGHFLCIQKGLVDLL